jgi:glycosyltransferase involved in cell wall biosynthesis
VHVGLIAPPWLPVPPPAYGGTEVVVDGLARGLVAAGHEVLLVTTGDSTCPVPRTWVYDQARTEDQGSVVVELRHVLHAYEAVDGVDIVHDHTVAGPVYAALRWHGPVVTTNHGPFTDDAKAVYRSIAGLVPIVAISHHQASTAGDVPIARVIHHGIDPTGFPVGGGQGGHLLFLGRLSPTKGVREAIDIARVAGVPLIIAAKMREVAEREYFDANVAPLLGRDIEYAGEVGRADKLRLLGAARALLNPIRWDEPFGLCMIEAMACGTPVISSHRGAAPEIVDEGVTGFLCRGNAEMVAAVARVGSLDRRSCRARVEARFSARRMVEDHVAFYTDVVAGRVDPPLDLGGCDRRAASGRRPTTHAGRDL